MRRPDLEMAGPMPALPGMEYADRGNERKGNVPVHPRLGKQGSSELERGGGRRRAALFDRFNRV